MKSWIAEKQDVLDMAVVLDSIPSRPGQPTSIFFQVEPKKKGVCFRITAEATAEVVLPGNGKWPLDTDFYLDRRTFLPFVLAAKDIKNDHPFEFLVKEKQLVIRNGKSRVGWFDNNKKVSGYGFPYKSDSAAVVQLDDKLRGMIYGARECSTPDVTTPQLNCVYLAPNGHGVEVLATNQKLVFRGLVHASKTDVKSGIPLPYHLVELLGSDQLKQVRWKEKAVELMFPNGRVWQSVSAQARKHFPAKSIRKYMKLGLKVDIAFQISSKSMSKVLERLCQYLTSVRRQDWVLRLHGKKGDSTLTLETTIAQTKFHERVKLKKSLKADLDLDWPLSSLEPVFQFLHSQKDETMVVRMSKGGRCYVQAGSVFLVVPARER